jgi:hypothetical protein
VSALDISDPEWDRPGRGDPFNDRQPFDADSISL